jgi:hypothetical protein
MTGCTNISAFSRAELFYSDHMPVQWAIKSRCVSLSPSLRRILNSIDFCQYHAHLYEVCQWLERHELLLTLFTLWCIQYGVLNTQTSSHYLLVQNWLFCYVTVFTKRHGWLTRIPVCYSRNPGLIFVRDYVILDCIFYHLLWPFKHIAEATLN